MVEPEWVTTGPDSSKVDMGGLTSGKAVGLLPTGGFLFRRSLALTGEGGRNFALECPTARTPHANAPGACLLLGGRTNLLLPEAV